MSRITGGDVKSMMEACAAVYATQEVELTEDQVWEEVEAWVNSLLEEGHDLSEYTWEEMYESYLSEYAAGGTGLGNQGPVRPGAFQHSRSGGRAQPTQTRTLYRSSSDNKVYRNYNDAVAARNSRLATLGAAQQANRQLGGSFTMPGAPGRPAPTGSATLNALNAPGVQNRFIQDRRPAAPGAPAANAPAPRPGAPAGQTVAAAGGKGGSVTVGKQYAATLGGQQGNVTYNAQGQKTFTPNKPAAGAPAPAAGSPNGPRVTPTGTPAPAGGTPAPAGGTPAAAPARPSLQSGIQDLQRMRAASLMRQQGRNMPDGSIPTGSSLAPKPAPAPAPAPSGTLASTVAAASRPAAFNPAPAAPAPAAAPRPVAAAPAAAPRPVATAPVAAARPVPATQARRPAAPAPTRAPILQRQSFDPFDIVMGYLISEGYAEDEKAAAVIMANMSDDWRQSIIEAKVDEKLPEHERSGARLARYDNPSGALALGGGQQRARREEHKERRGKKKD